MIKNGLLSQEEADKYPAEFKSAMQFTDHDFPPDVVAYMTEGVEFALKAELPEAEEAELWVYREAD